MDESALHWLRPLWLFAFVPLLLMFVIWLRRNSSSSIWARVVDPELQRYVIDDHSIRYRKAPLVLFSGWALAIVLLAGPVWEQQDVPVYQAQQAELVLFDLSQSMLSDDVAPSRLVRARFKLGDLLDNSEGRQTGLIAFTERPYIISPLTDDTRTIKAFLPSLDPDIMPVQGSRLDLAIDRAVTLLDQAGIQQGHILYVGDDNVDASDIDAARGAREAGHRLSVLAIGTDSGRPLRDETGQFLMDAKGSIVVPQVSMAAMRDLASAGGGIAVRLTPGDDDLQQLERVRSGMAIESDRPEEVTRKTYWVEYAPWLVWPLMIAMLWLFRRGVLDQ